MKIKELIEELTKFNPELEVQIFDERGANSLREPVLYEGFFEDDSPKMIRIEKFGVFVGLNNPDDYDMELEPKIVQ